MHSIHEKNIERLSEDSIFRVNGISMKLAKLGNEKKKRYFKGSALTNQVVL